MKSKLTIILLIILALAGSWLGPLRQVLADSPIYVAPEADTSPTSSSPLPSAHSRCGRKRSRKSDTRT